MPFTPPFITAATAGILIALQIILMLGVVLQRRSNRQSLGDGGHPDLLRAIRRHGNLAENAALFLVGFALLEVLGANTTTVATLCGAFVLVRVSHAVGLSMDLPVNPFRLVGAVGTVLVGGVLAFRLLALSWPHLLG